MHIRPATPPDIPALCKFTDYWIAGRGLAKHAPGATNDYFVSPSQHRKYIRRYSVAIAIDTNAIVAWAVLEPSGTLIHLLVAGTHRHRGLGTLLITLLKPSRIRSKSNQQSGNPAPFYEHLGYHLHHTEQSRGLLNIDKIRPDRPKIIEIFERNNTSSLNPVQPACQHKPAGPGPNPQQTGPTFKPAPLAPTTRPNETGPGANPGPTPHRPTNRKRP